MSQEDYYLEYSNVDLTNLKQWELEAVKLLKETVKLCGKIYAKQLNRTFLGANFYPNDATKEEIIEANAKNPRILNPYTVVVRDADGNLSSVDYSDYYSEEINKIHEIILKVAKLYEDNGIKEFQEYLLAFAKALKTGSYEDAEQLWLNIGSDIKVDIKLGPIETYQDKLFGIKKAFQGNLRIRNELEHANLANYIDVINAIIPDSPLKNGISDTSFIIRIDNVVAMGGWHVELIPRSSNYPADISNVKHGIKALIYTNNIARKQIRLTEIVKKVISTDLKDESQLEHAAVRVSTFHEIAEITARLKYPEAFAKLGYMQSKVIEIYASITGLKSASIQVLKGVLTIEEYQYALVNFVAQALRGWIDSKNNTSLLVYGDGYKLGMNYFLESEAIRLNPNKILEIDFTKLYSAIESLSAIVGQTLLNSDVEEAERVFSQYNDETKLNQIALAFLS